MTESAKNTPHASKKINELPVLFLKEATVSNPLERLFPLDHPYNILQNSIPIDDMLDVDILFRHLRSKARKSKNEMVVDQEKEAASHIRTGYDEDSVEDLMRALDRLEQSFIDASQPNMAYALKAIIDGFNDNLSDDEKWQYGHLLFFLLQSLQELIDCKAHHDVSTLMVLTYLVGVTDGKRINQFETGAGRLPPFGKSLLKKAYADFELKYRLKLKRARDEGKPMKLDLDGELSEYYSKLKKLPDMPAEDTFISDYYTLLRDDWFSQLYLCHRTDELISKLELTDAELELADTESGLCNVPLLSDSGRMRLSLQSGPENDEIDFLCEIAVEDVAPENDGIPFTRLLDKIFPNAHRDRGESKKPQ